MWWKKNGRKKNNDKNVYLMSNFFFALFLNYQRKTFFLLVPFATTQLQFISKKSERKKPTVKLHETQSLLHIFQEYNYGSWPKQRQQQKKRRMELKFNTIFSFSSPTSFCYVYHFDTAHLRPKRKKTFIQSKIPCFEKLPNQKFATVSLFVANNIVINQLIKICFYLI